MSAESVQVSVSTESGPMPALRWDPVGGTGPGILLLQEIFGLSPYIRRRGEALAAAGYVVLAPDLYWRLDEPPLDETDPQVVEVAMGRASALDWETTVADAVAGLQNLRDSDAVSDRVGIVGFCFGGGLGFNVAAEAEADVLVSYYGSAIPQLIELAPRVTLPSLYHFGLADDFIAPATVAESERPSPQATRPSPSRPTRAPTTPSTTTTSTSTTPKRPRSRGSGPSSSSALA